MQFLKNLKPQSFADTDVFLYTKGHASTNIPAAPSSFSIAVVSGRSGSNMLRSASGREELRMESMSPVSVSSPVDESRLMESGICGKFHVPSRGFGLK